MDVDVTVSPSSWRLIGALEDTLFFTPFVFIWNPLPPFNVEVASLVTSIVLGLDVIVEVVGRLAFPFVLLESPGMSWRISDTDPDEGTDSDSSVLTRRGKML